jgi:hypothetical protein
MIGGSLALAGWQAAASPLAAIQDGSRLEFQVSRDGSPIGTHSLAFSRAAGALTVRIAASFCVGFGPITFYRYRHTGLEHWQDGRFMALETDTNDGGSIYRVRAKRTDAGIAIEVNGAAAHLARPDTLPLTHWALADMSAPLFNPETGKILGETARKQGPGTVALADGRKIAATGYALAGDAPIEDWYDEASVWAALDAVGRDGSKITYRRS